MNEKQPRSSKFVNILTAVGLGTSYILGISPAVEVNAQAEQPTPSTAVPTELAPPVKITPIVKPTVGCGPAPTATKEATSTPPPCGETPPPPPPTETATTKPTENPTATATVIKDTLTPAATATRPESTPTITASRTPVIVHVNNVNPIPEAGGIDPNTIAEIGFFGTLAGLATLLGLKYELGKPDKNNNGKREE